MADEAATPDPPAPPPAAPVVVARWVQLVMLPLGVLALYALAHAAGVVLLLFIVAAVVALILNPLVAFVQRARLPRTLAVIAVYAVFFTAIPVTGFALSGPVADQATSSHAMCPGSSTRPRARSTTCRSSSTTRASTCRSRARPTALWHRCSQASSRDPGRSSRSPASYFGRLIELSFYVVLVLVLSIYMLIYGPQIGRLVRKVMPPGNGTPEDDFPTRVQRAVFGYVRGQLLVQPHHGHEHRRGAVDLRHDRDLPRRAHVRLRVQRFFGLMELIPYVGPLLGALPRIIVALAQDPLMAVWVALLFLALQQLEGHVVAPNIFGRSLRLNPLLVIFALLLGGEIYGFVGALVALPIAAILRETVVYLKDHLVFEPWGASSPLVVAQAPAPMLPPEAAALPGPARGRRRGARGGGGERRRACGRRRDRDGRPALGVQVVDPAHLPRVGLDLGQVEIHDDRLLA